MRPVLLLLAFAALAAAQEALVCDPQVCTNETYAIEQNKSTALREYHECLSRSRNVTAFICRCTPRIFECMQNVSLGGCSVQTARTNCWRYVTEQGLGCSQKLCKASAATASVAVITALATFVALAV